MTDNDEHKLSDEELETYLAGRHEVSDAYKALEKVTTPKSLDDRILAKARESVAGDSKGDIDKFYRPYAVAATVFLCLTVSFMFFNRAPAPDTDTPLFDTTEPVERRAALPEQSPAEAPAIAEDESAALEESAAPAAPAPLTAADDAASPPREVNLEKLLDQVEEQKLTETGQNFRAKADIQAEYRADRDTWIAEIRRLMDAGETQQAETETELFLLAYPDTDIEAALREAGQ